MKMYIIGVMLWTLAIGLAIHQYVNKQPQEQAQTHD